MENKRTKASLARYLLMDGLSVREVAERIGCNPRHVRWARAQSRKPVSRYARLDAELATLRGEFLRLMDALDKRGYLAIATPENRI
jgi:transposase-like protein